MIDLYSLATPNGQKIGVMLEETGLPYTPHVINIMEGDQHTEHHLSISPNGKIPAIIDRDGPDGVELKIMESGAILWYLARKSGKFLPTGEIEENEAMQWLLFQVGHVGPMFGQFGHFFVYAKDTCDHPYPLERYTNETRRLLGVLDKHLATRDYMLAAYSIVDMAIFPWVHCLDNYYKAGEHLALSEFGNVNAWLARCLSRPAVQRGMQVCDS